MILNDSEIEAGMQDTINAAWPPTKRERALRLGGSVLDELNAFFVQMTAEKAKRIAERDFAQALQDYSQAKTQLPNEPKMVTVYDKGGVASEVSNSRIAELQMIIDNASAAVVAAYAASAEVQNASPAA